MSDGAKDHLETKLVYVKRWRTLVSLPLKYADEIVESLRITPPAAPSQSNGDEVEAYCSASRKMPVGCSPEQIADAIEIISMCMPISDVQGGMWFGRNHNFADATFVDYGACRAFAVAARVLSNHVDRIADLESRLSTAESTYLQFCKKHDEKNEKLRDALKFIADGYDNQDVNHVDFRVKAYQVALDALEKSK